MKNYNAISLISILLLSIIFSVSIFNGEIGIFDNVYASSDESQSNKILKFSANGTSSDGNVVYVTHEGGHVVFQGQQIDVVPWGYVNYTQKGRMIVFLANVTENTFDIMFLHLINSSRLFGLQSFDYVLGSYEWANFIGNVTMMDELVDAPSVAMPNLAIEPKAKTSNKLFVNGKDMHMVESIGYLANNSKRLTIYPLFNDLDTSLGYNELWTLMVDDENNYYFSIFYMNSEDRNEVILSHTLRLQDFNARPRQHMNLNCSWSSHQKSYNMTVRFPLEKTTIQIDDFVFDTDGVEITIPVSSGAHEIYLKEKNGSSQGERYFLDAWSDGVTDNPRSIEIKDDTILSVSYKKQYRLIIESDYSNSSLDEWYDHGTNITVKVLQELYDDEDTRHIFVGWSGDFESYEKEITFSLDSPKKIIKEWKTQFKVTFTAENLSNGTALELRINNETSELIVPEVYEKWFDSGSEIIFELKGKEIEGSIIQYEVIEWQEETLGKISSPMVMDGPRSIKAVMERIKGNSNITCQVELDNILSHNQAAISGAITPPSENATVILYYGKANSTWVEVAKILTDENGEYLYFWVPSDYGFINIQASWDGDMEYEGAVSNRVTIYLSENAASFADYLGGSNSKIVQMTNENLPGVINRPVEPATNFVTRTMNKVYSTFNYLPIVGTLLTLLATSILLGMIYLVPFLFILLAIVAYLKGTKKWPQVLNTLLIFWLLALALLTFIEIVFINMIAIIIYFSLIFVSSLMVAVILILAMDRMIFTRIRTRL